MFLRKNTVVLKYGGSSVADADKIRSIATRVSERCKRGGHIVVVVSAVGKTIDGLIALAGTVSVAALNICARWICFLRLESKRQLRF